MEKLKLVVKQKYFFENLYVNIDNIFGQSRIGSEKKQAH